MTFDALVNCGYANANRIAGMLGLTSPTRQYEYVVAPIVELEERQRTSITILDGPFFSLLPFGSDGDHMINHVDCSVIAREDTPLLDPAWLDPATAPLAALDRQLVFETIRASCAAFMPSLERVRLKGFIEGPRMVLARVDDTDTRPSIVSRRAPGYVEVFSGKVDHCVWVGEEVAALLADG